jgi:twinkle protein
LPAFAAEDSASYYGADAAEHYYGEESLDGGGYGDGFLLDAPPLPPPSPSPPPPPLYYGSSSGLRAPAQQQQQQQPYQPPYFDPRRGGGGGAGGGGGYYPFSSSPSPHSRASSTNGRRAPSRSPTPNRDDDHGAYGLPPPPPTAPKRVSEMTAEERVALLVEKLRERGDIEVPPQMQRPGAHRLECPACGNGSSAEDSFAVTIRDDCALWCCHRSTCGYSGAVSVYGGYAPSEAPRSGGGGNGGALSAEDEEAAAADHIRQWRAQRAREEADGGGGGGGGGGIDGRGTASPSSRAGGGAGFSLPGTTKRPSSSSAAASPDDPSSIPVARPLVPRPDLRPLTPELLDWFAARGIGPRTLRRNGVSAQRRWSPQHRAEVDSIAFPYVRDGSVVNVKYRALPKAFSQTKGGEKVFYGYDDIQPLAAALEQEGSGGGKGGGKSGARAAAAEAAGAEAAGAEAAAAAAADDGAGPSISWLDEPGDVIIVEGELDKLSLEEAGFRRVVSVPDGAVARVKEGPLPAAGEETKFSYLQSAWPALRAATRVLLATDNDAPGAALADELARRIGREKCWRVEWPSDRGDSLTGCGGGSAAAAASASPSSGDHAEPTTPTTSDAKEDNDSDDPSSSPATKAPPPNPFFRKDANEVLVKDGPSALAAYVRRAQPLPIRGLFRFQAFWQQVHDLYRQGPGGLAWGASTGWPCVDPFYRVVPGELTIVTGVPNSGKSEWLDALLVNLARLHGWSFALCSMENRPADHARKLMEKYCGRPFYPPGVVSPAAVAGGGGSASSAAKNGGRSGKPTSLVTPSAPQRMTASELMESLVWVDERFHLIRSGDEELPSVEWVLERARAAVLRYGVRGLVIDPYNELDHRRPSHTSETEYVSQMLTRVKRFAQHYDCHVWFVAHPRQLQNWRGGAPSMYDISGSAHFINKADNGIVVHRPHAGLTAAGGAHGVAVGSGPGAGPGEAMAMAAAGPGAGDPFAVQLLVRKVRNKAAGRIGDALLRYDRATGTYADYDAFVSG